MQQALEKNKQGGLKVVLSWLVAIILIPVLIVADNRLFGGHDYYVVSVAALLLMMLPFVVSFEERKPTARELVVLAVLTAIVVAARVVFGFIPWFTPVTGIVVIVGIALGSSSGFIAGMLAIFVSNFVFGQGPWTPWQMFAFGFAGFFFGFLADRGVVPRRELGARSRLVLALGAVVFDVAVVGVLLDTCTLFTMMAIPTQLEGVIAVYGSGLVANTVRGVATFLTVYFLANPMLEKLDRIRVKYGLMG